MNEVVSKEKEKEIMDKLFGETTSKEDSSRVFATGARRNSAEGKGRYDLLPPEAIDALAKRFEYGAKLHGANNWRKGIPNSSLFDSALRHLFQALADNTDEDHLAACLWNVAVLIYNRAHNLGREVDDDINL